MPSTHLTLLPAIQGEDVHHRRVLTPAAGAESRTAAHAGDVLHTFHHVCHWRAHVQLTEFDINQQFAGLGIKRTECPVVEHMQNEIACR